MLEEAGCSTRRRLNQNQSLGRKDKTILSFISKSHYCCCCLTNCRSVCRSVSECQSVSLSVGLCVSIPLARFVPSTEVDRDARAEIEVSKCF